MEAVRASGRVVRLEGRTALLPIGTVKRPGWTKDVDSALVDYPYRLSLVGASLPPIGVDAVLDGRLNGRDLHVDRWEVEASPLDPWATPGVAGTDWDTASIVSDRVPESWPIISSGISTTTSGNFVVVLELDVVDGDTHSWLRQQAGGSVLLVPFIEIVSAHPAQARQGETVRPAVWSSPVGGETT